MMEVSVKVLVISLLVSTLDCFKTLFSLLLDECILCLHSVSLMKCVNKAFGIGHDDIGGVNVGTCFLWRNGIDEGIVDCMTLLSVLYISMFSLRADLVVGLM